MRTEAIVLRIHPFSRTSHMVTWLTPDHGRLVTPIKGACRPKSAFLGQYDLGYRCELLFYARERDGVHMARECTPLDGRGPLRDDWRSALVASYCCDLAARVAQPMLDAAGLFALLDRTLTALAGGGAWSRILPWFELGLLGQAGLAPSLAPCAYCNAERPDAGCRFALDAGRPVCPHAPAPTPGETTLSLSIGLWRALRDCQTAPEPDDRSAEPPAANLAVGMHRFLGMFLQRHLETSPAARRAMFDWLALDLDTLRARGAS